MATMTPVGPMTMMTHTDHHALEFIPIPIPIAAPSEPLASTLVPIASTDDIRTPQHMGGAIEGGTSHDNDDQHDDGAGDGCALMQGPESIWKKDAGERGRGWRVLEDAIYASLYVKGCYFGKLCIDSGLISTMLASALLAKYTRARN
ncbi:hypothetical protein EDD85DRAFT_798841 [Armillaria nabsnona]|nr:hypothetical protein EDD85DRAFT_798841 [Armillaria nabsnona]